MSHRPPGSLPLKSDAELLLASRGEPAAFRELYDRWAPRLLRYFMRRVFDVDIAADLLAETFAVAYERRARFNDSGAPGAAWLYGIASKELSHFFRRRQVELRAARRLGLERPPVDRESELQIAAMVEEDDYRDVLQAALSRLPAGTRRAVELRIVEELEYEQIAERLGCRASAARTRVHRGLARLNDLMKEPS